jgi:hypothetical protein
VPYFEVLTGGEIVTRMTLAAGLKGAPTAAVRISEVMSLVS